jgi:hypothetical protein
MASSKMSTTQVKVRGERLKSFEVEVLPGNQYSFYNPLKIFIRGK